MQRPRILVFPLVALLLVACSRAAEIPHQQLGAKEYRKPGSYKVRLHGWNEYNVRRFSMTDSTVVIEELLVHDDHYKLKQHDMPIVVPLKDVEYIGVMKTNWGVTALAVAAVGAVAGLIVGLSHIGPFGQ
jgi:hypothetical protein